MIDFGLKTQGALLVGAIALVNASAAEPVNMVCQFNAFIRLQHDRPIGTETVPIDQRMRIVNSETDSATLRLDGSRRATNSRRWTRMDVGGWETNESWFVGDFREILVLQHALGDNRKPLRGSFKAALSTPSIESTQVSLGGCIVEQ